MPVRNVVAKRGRSKRIFDTVVAAVGLVIASPLMAAIAIAVRATSPGPALHRASRIGRHGVPFTLYKFRSMRISTDDEGARITAAGDARITRVGRFLRSTKLDELPQLVNVLRGDMSIVGPRPEDPTYVNKYTAAQKEILTWRPGLTSPASIEYRHEEDILSAAGDLDAAYATIMAAKLELDLAYFSTSSLRSDVVIVMRTIRSLFSHGA
jgi:lipopolysaccharide/colanic/teichoic acid biosynthesis glycosyltransferase